MASPTSRRLRLWLACALGFACGGGPAGQGTDAADTHAPGIALTSGAPPPGVVLTEGVRPDKFDLGATGGDGDSDGGGAAKGCEKVDFLFVIDNSGSMAEEQASLIASFPGFIAAIEATVTATDYHIMAISSDNGDYGNGDDDCQFNACICAPAPTCCQDVCDTIFDRSCNGVGCDDITIDPCEFEYGSGRVHDQHGDRCPIVGGRRYMLESEPQLAQSFACAAGIGVFGSGDEKPVHAALAALGADQNGPGGCNEGFLRDDAILVLVIITDEEDDNVDLGDGSPGAPGLWYEQVVAAKHGDAGAVVVLGLVGDGNLPGGQCPAEGDPDEDDAESAPRLQAFISMFGDNGFIGSVCASDYAPFFLEAVDVIDAACDTHVPVG